MSYEYVKRPPGLVLCDFANGHTDCMNPARWWFREFQQQPWHRRCGLHAQLHQCRPNQNPRWTLRERRPLAEPKPADFEPLESVHPKRPT